MTWPNLLSLVIVLAAVVLTYLQVCGSRFQQRVDLLFRIEDVFFQREKLERAVAAKAILRGDFVNAEPVLDQLETIALLVEKGALDTEMVWHTFFYWLNNYYAACEPYIRERQKADPIYWQDLTALVPVAKAGCKTQGTARRFQQTNLGTGQGFSGRRIRRGAVNLTACLPVPARDARRIPAA